ncbi:hypothetical protein CTZ27_10715 [Streptomyces griseocarneus]|nr:hypothetical protein CTZ27_10715 [Streptomyces griseocarneus]
MRRLVTALAPFGAALSLTVAAPTNASAAIHFYVYSNPSSNRAELINVVDRVAGQGEHQTGHCKNVRGGRDFYNDSGHTIRIYTLADCAQGVGHAYREIPAGEHRSNMNHGFQSVRVF